MYLRRYRENVVTCITFRSTYNAESRLGGDKGISKPVSAYNCQSMLMRKNNVRTSVVG